MDEDVSAGVTRLDVLKDAVEAMFNSGNINAVFITRSRAMPRSTTRASNGGWYTNLTDALAVVDGLNANDSTDYDAALAAVTGNYDGAAGRRQPDHLDVPVGRRAERKQRHRLRRHRRRRSGRHRRGTAWINFLTTNNFAKSFAFGFGGLDSGDVANLEPIAWQPGETVAQHDADDVNDADDDTNVIIVDNVNDLSQVLITAIGGDAGGNVLTDGAIDDAFGADGGRILSVEVDVPGEVPETIVYTWNGTSSIDPGTPGSSADDIAGNSLSVVTEQGGTFVFNFANGVWSYTTPNNVTHELHRNDHLHADRRRWRQGQRQSR